MATENTTKKETIYSCEITTEVALKASLVKALTEVEAINLEKELYSILDKYNYGASNV